MLMRSNFQQSVSVGMNSSASEQVVVNVVIYVKNGEGSILIVRFLCHFILLLAVSNLAEWQYTNSPAKRLLFVGDDSAYQSSW